MRSWSLTWIDMKLSLFSARSTLFTHHCFLSHRSLILGFIPCSIFATYAIVKRNTLYFLTRINQMKERQRMIHRDFTTVASGTTWKSFRLRVIVKATRNGPAFSSIFYLTSKGRQCLRFPDSRSRADCSFDNELSDSPAHTCRQCQIIPMWHCGQQANA